MPILMSRSSVPSPSFKQVHDAEKICLSNYRKCRSDVPLGRRREVTVDPWRRYQGINDATGRLLEADSFAEVSNPQQPAGRSIRPGPSQSWSGKDNVAGQWVRRKPLDCVGAIERWATGRRPSVRSPRHRRRIIASRKLPHYLIPSLTDRPRANFGLGTWGKNLSRSFEPRTVRNPTDMAPPEEY
jgi:hypothetical protein